MVLLIGGKCIVEWLNNLHSFHMQPLLNSLRNPKTSRSSLMIRWCGSAKPRGSRSLLTGGWKMARIWNPLRWVPTSRGATLKEKTNLPLVWIGISSARNISCRVCAAEWEMSAGVYGVFWAFPVLIFQAFLNYLLLLSSSWHRILRSVMFDSLLQNSLTLKILDSLSVSLWLETLPSEQNKYFSWNPRCWSFFNLLLNLPSTMLLLMLWCLI